MNLFISFLMFFSMIGWAEPPRKVKRAALGQEFTLKVGQEVSIKEAGLKITFASVAEDSRCPKGVDCIWAGNGKIVVKISKGGSKPTELQLNTGIEPKQLRFDEYDIKFIQLNPYPEHKSPIKPGSYAATLVISK